VLMAVLARRLPSVDFGQFVYALWLVEVSFLFCAFGMNGSASRYFAEYSHDSQRRAAFARRWLPWALTLPMISGIAAVAGAILSGLTLMPLSYILLGTWAMAMGWWSMQTGALTGQQRFDLVLVANVMSTAVAIVAVLSVPIAGHSPEVLFGVMTLSSLVGCAFGIRQNIWSLTGPADVETVHLPWSRIRGYATNIWLTGLLGALVWSRGELPLVRSHLGDGGVAQYTVALTLYFGAMQAIMLWVSGVAPHLTSAWGRDQGKQAIADARRLSDVQLLMSGSAAVLLICFGTDMLGLAFGASYRASGAYLAILAPGLITLSASAQSHLLQIDTDAKFNRNASLLGLIVLYSLASSTIPWLGVAGAAIARALTMWAMFLMTLIVVRRSWERAALSGRNTVFAICAAGVAGVLVAGSDTHYLLRALIALLCVGVLALLIRGEGRQSVAFDVISAGWSRLSR
jgi:O-antigen/teichoic acid export membrane protein